LLDNSIEKLFPHKADDESAPLSDDELSLLHDQCHRCIQGINSSHYEMTEILPKTYCLRDLLMQHPLNENDESSLFELENKDSETDSSVTPLSPITDSLPLLDHSIDPIEPIENSIISAPFRNIPHNLTSRHSIKKEGYYRTEDLLNIVQASNSQLAESLFDIDAILDPNGYWRMFDPDYLLKAVQAIFIYLEGNVAFLEDYLNQTISSISPSNSSVSLNSDDSDHIENNTLSNDLKDMLPPSKNCDKLLPIDMNECCRALQGLFPQFIVKSAIQILSHSKSKLSPTYETSGKINKECSNIYFLNPIKLLKFMIIHVFVEKNVSFNDALIYIIYAI
jgi:hypothetical protein